jgi:acetyltransferase-like isoleucine patch superfamily enzyme
MVKKKYFKNLGFKKLLQFLFFQNIMRINGNIPWPVHWTSKVTGKITRKEPTAYVGISPGCYIQGINGIEIDVGCRVGPGVKMISSSHDIYDFDRHVKANPIKIGKFCWIGANVVILPEVVLGDHTIVAAGSIVTKSFEKGNYIIGGNPARVISRIDDYKGKTCHDIEF